MQIKADFRELPVIYKLKYKYDIFMKQFLIFALQIFYPAIRLPLH